MHTLRDSLMKWGTILVLFLTPLLWIHRSIYPHMTSKTFFFYGATCVLGAMGLYSMIIDVRYRLTKYQWLGLAPLIVYVSWMVVSTTQAVSPGLAVWSSFQRGTGLLMWLSGLVFAIVVSSLIRRYGMRDIGTRLLYTVAATGTIVAISVWGSNQGLNWHSVMLEESKGGGFLGNSSLAGAYVLLTIFVSLILLIRSSTPKKHKWMLMIGLAIMLFSPLYLNVLGFFNGDGILGTARGALLGILVGCGSALLFYLVLAKKRRVQIVGVSGIGVSLILFIVLWTRLLTPGTALHDGFIKAASGTRLLFWDIATQALHERPVFGYGPENFNMAFQQYFNPDILLPEYGHEAWTDRSHNVFYENAATMGWPGVVLYSAFLLGLIGLSIRAYRVGALSRGEAALFAGMIVGYTFQNLFVFDSTTSIMMLLVITGFLAGIQSKESSLKAQIKYTYAVPLVIFLGLLGITGLYYLSYRPFQKAKLFGIVMSQGINTRSKHYLKLTSGSSVGNQWDVSGVAHDVFTLYGTNPAKIKSDTKLLPYAKEDVLAFIKYAETVAQKNKTDYRLYLSIVHLYSTYIYLSDMPYDPALAAHIEIYLNHAKELSPTDPQVEWSHAQLAAWKGDLPAVVQAYESAIAIKPSFPISHTLLLNFLKSIGATDMYKVQLIKAQKDVPGFTM